MNISIYIAKRYILSKSGQNAINILNYLTYTVLLVGTAALFVVLSFFGGLKTIGLQYAETDDPSIRMVPKSGKFTSFTADQKEILENIDALYAFSLGLQERVYLTYKDKGYLAEVKGVSAAYMLTSNIDSTIYAGNWLVKPNDVVIGHGIFSALGVPLKNHVHPLVAMAPNPKELGKSIGFSSKSPYFTENLQVSGVFAASAELDASRVYAPIETIREFLNKPNDLISEINLSLSEEASPNEVKEKLEQKLGHLYQISTKEELNKTIFKMLNTEKTATYLIFTLVLIIALFNMIGALIMMIIDKKENLKTLLSLGMRPNQVRNIFFAQGTLITFIGGISGILVGVILVFAQQQTGILRLTPSVAYPVALEWSNVFLVFVTIAWFGIIASLIASYSAKKALT